MRIQQIPSRVTLVDVKMVQFEPCDCQSKERAGAQPSSEENEGPPRGIHQIPGGHSVDSVDIRSHERSVETLPEGTSPSRSIVGNKECHLFGGGRSIFSTGQPPRFKNRPREG